MLDGAAAKVRRDQLAILSRDVVPEDVHVHVALEIFVPFCLKLRLNLFTKPSLPGLWEFFVSAENLHRLMLRQDELVAYAPISPQIDICLSSETFILADGSKTLQPKIKARIQT